MGAMSGILAGIYTPGMATRIRYLDAAAVTAAMPPIEERLALAERAMTALVADADLPPKIGVHPRPEGSFAHAMPALLRGADASGSADRLGIKWVTGFPANRDRDLPAIHAVVILSDATTGEPVAILDGGPITAQRTAAVSGVAIARFGPSAAMLDGRAPRAAIVGAGVQGHSHLEVLGHLVPGVHLAVHDRTSGHAERLAEVASATAGVAAVTIAPTARDAVRDADIVITTASFTTPERRQPMTNDWLAPDVLAVPVDYATMVAAEVARSAALFLVDERGQFAANRDAGLFDGYPDPVATLGEAILTGTSRPGAGRVVVTHLGVGLADVVFADAIVRRAEAEGLGVMLPR
jgi:ornithine cyclodeaminase/alanine dehydrogenase-like protein (mu-crystallin family)